MSDCMSERGREAMEKVMEKEMEKAMEKESSIAWINRSRNYSRSCLSW